MKNNNRSILILKFLFDNTDLTHTATISNINEYLYGHELEADRKTISDCIAQLKALGYDIRCVRKRQNHYYLNSRSFSLAEIKLLIDAVQSSRFISEKDSSALVDKLTKLAGDHHGETLKRHLYLTSRSKTENDDVSKIIQTINDAIDFNRDISFQYFEYNQLKEKILRHNGHEYIVSPHKMVWNTDQYYLVGFNDKHQTECKYRLDRMCSVKMLDKPSMPLSDDFEISQLFNQEFSMMSGEQCEVHLLCCNELMDSIVDKFGLEVRTNIVDDNHFEVIALVKLSKIFYGWVFSSQGKMKIIAPNEAVEGFENVIKIYK